MAHSREMVRGEKKSTPENSCQMATPCSSVQVSATGPCVSNRKSALTSLAKAAMCPRSRVSLLPMQMQQHGGAGQAEPAKLMLSAAKGYAEASWSVAHRRDEQQSEAQARQPQVTDGGVLEFARTLGSGLEGYGGAANLAGECTPASLQSRGTGLVTTQSGTLSVLACSSVHAYQGD